MKRTAVALLSLLWIPWALSGLQTGFVDTIQDFKSRLIDFREDGLMGRFRDGVLVDPSPAELEVGDVFIDVDGRAKMVSRVEKSGSDIYIDTVQPGFEDVYLYAEVPYQTISFTEDNFLPRTLGEDAYTVTPSSDAKGTFNIKFEKELYSKPPSVVKLSASAALTSDISIGFKAPTYVKIKIRTWKFWQWKISFKQENGYIQGGLSYDLALTGSLVMALEKSLESTPIQLYGFGTPTSGISAGLGLYTKTVLEGTLSLELPLTFGVNGSAGAKCTLQGQVPVMWPTDVTTWGNTGYSLDLTPTLTVEGKLKQKFYLGAEVTLVGIKVTEFEAGGGPYLKLSGTLSGSIGYSSTEGLIGPSWSGDVTGQIGLFMGISGKVFDGKWSVTIMDLEFPFYTVSLSTSEILGGRPGAALPTPFPVTVE